MLGASHVPQHGGEELQDRRYHIRLGSAISLAKYLLPIRYLLEMLRSRLGSASLPPFPYVQGGKGSVLSFFPASYIFLHIRILTFILFHVRSNELLDSRNFLSFSLTR